MPTKPKAKPAPPPATRKTPAAKVRKPSENVCPECGATLPGLTDEISEVNSFYLRHRIQEISDEKHPSLYRMDQWLRMVLDAMKGQCFLEHYYEGSPLSAAYHLAQVQVAKGGASADAHAQFLVRRIGEAVALRDKYKTGTAEVKRKCADALRSRGLMK